jgi:hypothetical protein
MRLSLWHQATVIGLTQICHISSLRGLEQFRSLTGAEVSESKYKPR